MTRYSVNEDKGITVETIARATVPSGTTHCDIELGFTSDGYLLEMYSTRLGRQAFHHTGVGRCRDSGEAMRRLLHGPYRDRYRITARSRFIIQATE